MLLLIPLILHIQLSGDNANYHLSVTHGGAVGIGTTSPGSYNSNTNNFVIRDSGSGGITISTGASNTGYVAFNDGEDTTIEGLIAYNQSNDVMSFRTASTDDRLVIDGSIMLYYDNSLKFETTTSGIAVTGGVAASGSDQVFTATAADGTYVHYVGGNAATGSLDDEESFTFTMANGGLFTVPDSTTRYAGVFAFSYASSTIVEISDPDNKFVTTNTDSGNLIAVYTTTNSHVVTVHNRTNSTQTLRVYAHGDVSAASGIS